MGWFKVTVEFVLKVAQLDFSPLLGHDIQQAPLLTPPAHDHNGHALAPSAPDVFTRSIKCEYPELEAQGWEFCNDKDHRDCWIRDPSETQPGFTQYDVRTNCARSLILLYHYVY